MLAHHRKDSCKKTDMKTMKSKPTKDSRGSMIFFQPEIRNRNKKPLTQTLIWFDYSKNSIILHAKKIQASKLHMEVTQPKQKILYEATSSRISLASKFCFQFLPQ
jgi:hypothetical protein